MFLIGKERYLLLLALPGFYGLNIFKNARELSILHSNILDFLLGYHRKESFANKKLQIEIFSTDYHFK